MIDGKLFLLGVVGIIGLFKLGSHYKKVVTQNFLIKKKLGPGAFKQLVEEEN